ncbi:hypothetical protein JCM21900_006010 [Sporobolomyces salmonicolor]
MPRPRNDPDTTSQSDDSSDSLTPSRRRPRPKATRKGLGQAATSLCRRRGITNDETTSSSESSPSSSDTDDDGAPRKRPRSGPPPYSPSDPTQQQTRSCLVLFVGVAIALCLALLGAFALYKYIGAAGSEFSSTSSVASSGGSEPATVTVTLLGGHVSTITKPGSSRATPTFSGVSKNNIGIGFLPDDNGQTMSDITSGLDIRSSFYGWYAQLPKTGDLGGSQLMSQMSDIKSCSCIFQPYVRIRPPFSASYSTKDFTETQAVMPTTGWTGLTSSDNSQALAVAKGTADNFNEGWAAVAAAVADNDLVKMFFTPNVASSLDDYLAHMPNDTSTIDYIGIGTYYYPKDSSPNFTDTMQGLYDQYCKDGTIKFPSNGITNERLAWLAQITSEATSAAMPNFVGVSWFNYLKSEDYRLWIPGDSSANSASQARVPRDGRERRDGGGRLGGDCAAEAEVCRKAAENNGQGRLD